MLKGKTVILGVTGSIAAYKMANLTSMLVKRSCDVHVLMTKNAVNFINPITFETLTGHKCLVDTFDRNFNYNIEHVALADKADAVLVAPASADIIGKLANGIADDMLTTTCLACTCKKIVAPAMNTNMWDNPIVQDNIEKLRRFNVEIVEPESGVLACGAKGSGRLPADEVLLEYILKAVRMGKDLEGKKVLVTAGATREAIDPVRYITNHSTGKMGYALARIAMRRGADVTLVSGPTNIKPPICVNVVPAVSALEMFEAVKELAPDMDIIIKAAAVADYTPAVYSDEKIKKSDGDLALELVRTADILSYLGKKRKEGQVICGFSMETENLLENSRKKLIEKNIDLIVANNLREEGAGFGTDTNIVALIMKEGVEELPRMPKEQVAEAVLDAIVSQIPNSKAMGI